VVAQQVLGWLDAWPWSPSTPERGVPTPCHSQRIAHWGTCGKTRVVPQNHRPKPEPAEMGVAKCVCCCRRMGRAGTSNRWWDSWCGCGHSARRCGCARHRTRTSRSGWPVSACRWCPSASQRALTTGAPSSSAANLPRHVAELIASQFDAVTAAADGCVALVATGVMPAAAGARSVAEKLGIRSVYATFQQPRKAAHARVNHAGPSSQEKYRDWTVLRGPGDLDHTLGLVRLQRPHDTITTPTFLETAPGTPRRGPALHKPMENPLNRKSVQPL
jgi:hypothetical protein